MFEVISRSDSFRLGSLYDLQPEQKGLLIWHSVIDWQQKRSKSFRILPKSSKRDVQPIKSGSVFVYILGLKIGILALCNCEKKFCEGVTRKRS